MHPLSPAFVTYRSPMFCFRTVFVVFLDSTCDRDCISVRSAGQLLQATRSLQHSVPLEVRRTVSDTVYGSACRHEPLGNERNAHTVSHWPISLFQSNSFTHHYFAVLHVSESRKMLPSRCERWMSITMSICYWRLASSSILVGSIVLTICDNCDGWLIAHFERTLL